MTSEEGSWAVGVIIAAVVIVGIVIFIDSKRLEYEPTCESVKMEIFAFQQCIKMYPSCRIQGGQKAVEYQIKLTKWAANNCPKNGDGFQSQSMISE